MNPSIHLSGACPHIHPAKHSQYAYDPHFSSVQVHGSHLRSSYCLFVCVRGSSTSRSQSPREMTPRTVSVIASPGKVATHQLVVTYCLPSLSMPPQEMSGGLMPRPRKLSEA